MTIDEMAKAAHDRRLAETGNPCDELVLWQKQMATADMRAAVERLIEIETKNGRSGREVAARLRSILEQSNG